MVVTGASSGIGRACALDLARRGFAVHATVRREEDARALERDAQGSELRPHLLDITDEAAVHATADTVAAATGAMGLWGLVNNAGLALPGPVELLPIDQLRRQFEVNVIGQVTVTQAFLPLIRRARGRIVNIGSVSGRVAAPFVGAYAASKHALRALNDSLRVEVRPFGVSVSLIEPAPIATAIWERSAETSEAIRAGAPDELRALYGGVLDAMPDISRAFGAHAVPPEAVCRAIRHALTARRPRRRYCVGRHWLALWLADQVPAGVKDWLMAVYLRRLRGR